MEPAALRLVETHLGLAQSIAQQVWRTAPHALDAEELRAIAYLGLVAAADRWYPYCREKNYSADALEFFKPFAVRRIKGQLIDTIRSSDWASRNLRTRARALQAAGQDRGATDIEMAECTGMSLATVRATIRDMAARPVSLEAEEVDPGAAIDVESSVFTRAVLTRVVATIAALPAEEQTVIALHYHRGLQLQHVAQAMAIPESRASQLHAHAVLTIHQAMVTIAQEVNQPA